jgi:hypothetical protein
MISKSSALVYALLIVVEDSHGQVRASGYTKHVLKSL